MERKWNAAENIGLVLSKILRNTYRSAQFQPIIFLYTRQCLIDNTHVRLASGEIGFRLNRSRTFWFPASRSSELILEEATTANQLSFSLLFDAGGDAGGVISGDQRQAFVLGYFFEQRQ